MKNFKSIKVKMAAHRPLFTRTGLILRNIMKTAQDSYTITIKQIVSFQERMHLKKFKSIKSKMAAYRPLFTSTGLILWNIMKTAQDSYTITIKQIVRFQERMHFEKFQLDLIKFKMAAYWPLFTSTGLI